MIIVTISFILYNEGSKSRNVTIVNVTSPGSLSGILGGEINRIVNLKLTGTIGAADFLTLRDQMPQLSILDISSVVVEGNMIPDSAFCKNKETQTSLVSIKLPNSIKRIGAYAFYNCSNIRGFLIIPSGVTKIGAYAFYNCCGLTGLTISCNVTHIGMFAFYGCQNFTGLLTIPHSVTDIGLASFFGCSGFKSIKVYWEEPIIYNGDMLPVDKTVRVPADLVDIYKSVYGWQRHSIVAQ